jgi:pyrimidine operon attenuation protein / uracil phosphoribosyltransferase
MKKKTIILNKAQIEQRTRRMAFEIIESCYGISEVVLIGIEGNGVEFNNRIKKILEDISDIKVTQSVINIEKNAPLTSEINMQPYVDLNDKHIIMVDDVVNSGRTMIYAVSKVLESPIKSLKTVSLVDRTHRRFPIQVDFSGIELSTTLQDNILVDFKEEIAFLE